MPAVAVSTRVADEPAGLHDFDFLVGEWRVRHRSLRSTPRGREWMEAEGTCSHRPLIGGAANLEEHAIDAPSGSYRAVALRSFDRRSGQWNIWWLDGRDPSRSLDPPVVGRFEEGVGTFYGEEEVDGKPIPVRFVWSEITASSARWEQAYSHDGGTTWEPNWTMELERRAADPPAARTTPESQPTAGARNPGDFDFLVGTWRFHNHRLNDYYDSESGWTEFAGTMVSRPLLGGAANVDENTLELPSGAYRAVALRAYDEKTKQWSIWWLDGRYPSGPLEPPVRGSFENGVGRFYSESVHEGKPVRTRFLWQAGDGVSPRWEQALSLDGGKTWSTNWVMQFERVPEGTAPTLESACCPVVELRQYTLRDGQRDALVDLFDREFVESQEAIGMRIVGQFRDLDRENRFVWIRGFPDMQQRKRALTDFYQGTVWKAHSKAANATMVDVSDVLLLRPAPGTSGFALAGLERPAPGASTPPRAVVVAVMHSFDEPPDEDSLAALDRDLSSALVRAGATIAGRFVSETAANDFPALPVREGEHVFVLFATFADPDAAERWASEPDARAGGRTQVLRLAPTPRSLLGSAAAAQER